MKAGYVTIMASRGCSQFTVRFSVKKNSVRPRRS